VVPVGEVDVLEGDDLLPAGGRLGEADADGLFGAEGGFDPLHAVELLLLRLGLGSLGGLGAEAGDEALELLHLALLGAVGGELAGVAGGGFLEVVVVVPAVGVHPVVADLEDLADDRVEEGAVVADEQEGAAVPAEVALEPAEALEVEVVGGLVEEEQVRLGGEEPGEVGTHHPAAAEFPGGAVVVGLAKGEPGEDPPGPRLDLVASDLAVAGDRLVVVRVEPTGPLGRPDTGAKGGVLRGDSHSDLQHGLLSQRRRLLGQVADADAFLPHDPALVRLVLAEQEGKQGRLARAVRADEGRPFPGFEVEGRVLEENLRPEGLVDAGHLQHPPNQASSLARANDESVGRGERDGSAPADGGSGASSYGEGE